MTEHFYLFAALIARGDTYPKPAYQKAKELLAAYNTELEHEEDQARLEAALAGAAASGSQGSTSGDVEKPVSTAAQDSQ